MEHLQNTGLCHRTALRRLSKLRRRHWPGSDKTVAKQTREPLVTGLCFPGQQHHLDNQFACGAPADTNHMRWLKKAAWSKTTVLTRVNIDFLLWYGYFRGGCSCEYILFFNMVVYSTFLVKPHVDWGQQLSFGRKILEHQILAVLSKDINIR